MIPVDKNLLFSKNDPLDPRLGEWVESTSQTSDSVAILGYPDDRGIAANQGRVGAAQAPDAIRKLVYRMTPDPQAYFKDPSRPHNINEKLFSILDCGNITVQDDLTSNHLEAFNACADALRKHPKVISLGGGHDYGFPDGKAFIERCKSQKSRPLIINFDAHLDVRPPGASDDGNVWHSGTPFYRLLTEYKDFDFWEVGLQPQCNSPAHLQWALKHNTDVYMLNDLRRSSFTTDWLEKLRKHQNQPCFVSLDMDVFSSAVAPGCSASWPSGLMPNEFEMLFLSLQTSLNVHLLGIYEVSPPLDSDSRTAKLAAQIIHKFMFTSPRKS